MWPVLGGLLACGHVELIPPVYPDWPYTQNPCGVLDEPAPVSDLDASATGFSAVEAVDFLDGAELDAVYDPEYGEGAADPLPSERIQLRASRTAEPVLFVNRTEAPPDVMPEQPCLVGPLLRVPVRLSWSMQVGDAVAWWTARREVTFASATDPTRIDVFLSVDYYGASAIPDPVLAGYVEAHRPEGEQVYRTAMTAWGRLASGDKLAFESSYEVPDELGTDHWVLFRYGSWTWVPPT